MAYAPAFPEEGERHVPYSPAFPEEGVRDSNDLGEIRLAYTPEELATMFYDYAKARPAIHQEVRNFQMRERHFFLNTEENVCDGVHRLEWTDAHRRYVELLGAHIDDFLRGANSLEQDFADVLEECKKHEGSLWWMPFSMMLDTTSYAHFAKMLQDNVCLCCGGPFAGYKAEELAEKFHAYVIARPHIQQEVRRFQVRERHIFKGVEESVAAGEHRLDWSEAHRRYVAMLDTAVVDFLREAHGTEQEFAAMLDEYKLRCDPSWFTPFSLLLDTSDYSGFARMMQNDVCLCCGGPFKTDEELAQSGP